MDEVNWRMVDPPPPPVPKNEKVSFSSGSSSLHSPGKHVVIISCCRSVGQSAVSVCLFSSGEKRKSDGKCVSPIPSALFSIIAVHGHSRLYSVLLLQLLLLWELYRQTDRDHCIQNGAIQFGWDLDKQRKKGNKYVWGTEEEKTASRRTKKESNDHWTQSSIWKWKHEVSLGTRQKRVFFSLSSFLITLKNYVYIFNLFSSPIHDRDFLLSFE